MAALLFSLVLVAMAPFFGDLQEELRDLLPSAFARALGAVFGVAMVAAFVLAALRIRERRLLRYSLLAVWLLLLAGQLTLWSRSSAAENAVERMHFVFYNLVALLFYRAFRARDDGSVGPLTLLSAVMVGIVDESLQWLVPVRAADFVDIVINGYAAVAGLFLGAAIWPPQTFRWRMGRASASRLSVVAVAFLILLAGYIHTAHLGYFVEDREIGGFRSLYSMADLERLTIDRARQWAEHPPGPPGNLSSTEIEDYYRSEGGWRVHRRNDYLEEDRYFAAWKENQILEKYFSPFLDLPNDYGGTARWPAHVVQRVDRGRAGVERHDYVSPVGLFPRHAIWLRPTRIELWGGVLGMSIVLLWWRRRIQRLPN